jgi:hypothetical protein
MQVGRFPFPLEQPAMTPLAYHVDRATGRTRSGRPVILLQVGRSGLLRGFQLCDSWNLSTLETEPTRDVATLRRSYPEFAFVLVSSDRSHCNPAEQWEALGNPAGFLRTR